MTRTHFISRYLASSFFLVISLLLSAEVHAGPSKAFKTSYCDIHYTDEKSLNDFFWRIGGKRFNFDEDISLARSRVDRLVDRVQSILDMYPDKFYIKIELYPKHKKGLIASYNQSKNTIIVYADKVTDGVLAHEVAHAVICSYFEVPPPEKMQEILTQYVDKHLWDDY